MAVERTHAPNDVVVLGIDTEEGKLVTLPYRDRASGMYVIGATGTGKSTLLENLIIQDAWRGHGLCLIDPHGDITDHVIARLPEHRLGDVVLLNPEDTENPFGLNIFACRNPDNPVEVTRTVNAAIEVFEKLWGGESATPSWGPRMEQVLRNVAHTMVGNPGYTLVEVPRLLTDEHFRAKLVANVRNRQVRHFWEQQFNPLPRREQLERTESTLNKLDEFLTDPLIRNIVGQPETTINLRTIMDAGNILLVRLVIGNLGPSTVSLLGLLLVGEFLKAALSRADTPPAARRLFLLYADEFQRFATPDSADLLPEGRKFGVAATVAHQFRGQIPRDDRLRGATLNVGSLVVFRVSGEDAQELSTLFDATPPPPDPIGQRPVYGYATDVLRELKTGGATNPIITQFVQGQLIPIEQQLERYKTAQNRRESDFITSGDISLAQAETLESKAQRRFAEAQVNELTQAPQYINSYLHKRMTGEDASGALFVVMRYLANEFAGIVWYTQEQREPTLADVTWETLEPFIQNPANADVQARVLAAALPQLQAKFPNRDPQRLQQDIWGSLHRAGRFLTQLYQVGELLAARPIRLPTGTYEDILGTPRAYADVYSEIAAGLATLNNHTAVCRLLQDGQLTEWQFRTERPEAFAPTRAFRQRLRQLWEQKRHGGYTRDRAQVEAEIEQRGRVEVEPPPPLWAGAPVPPMPPLPVLPAEGERPSEPFRRVKPLSD